VGIHRSTLASCLLLIFASCTYVPPLTHSAEPAADGGRRELESEHSREATRAQPDRSVSPADAAPQPSPPSAAAGAPVVASAGSNAAGSGASVGSAGAAGQPPPQPAASSDAAVADAGDAAVVVADTGPAPECKENDGRCQSTSERQLCESGKWVTKPCDANTVCVPNALIAPGACTPVDPHCRGSEGKSACDSSGKLYLCDAYAVAYHTEQCMSRENCQTGAPYSRCSPCVTGEFKCDNGSLVQCSPGGPTAWTTPTVCAPNLHCGPNDPPCLDAGL
jgi:hypothetical protein